MEGFRRGDFQVLVATNIAARGLDVDPHHARHQLRRAERAGRLRPPHRPHRPGPRRRATPSCWSPPPRRNRWRRSSGTSASACRASPCRTSITNSRPRRRSRGIVAPVRAARNRPSRRDTAGRRRVPEGPNRRKPRADQAGHSSPAGDAADDAGFRPRVDPFALVKCTGTRRATDAPGVTCALPPQAAPPCRPWEDVP